MEHDAKFNVQTIHNTKEEIKTCSLSAAPSSASGLIHQWSSNSNISEWKS